MKNRMVYWLMVVVGLSASLVWSQSKGPAGFGMHRFPKALNLTDEQKQVLKEQSLPFQKEMIRLKAQWESKRLDLKAEMDAVNPEVNKINALVDEAAKIRAEMAKKRIAQELALVKLLTPEQRKVWQESKEKRNGEFFRQDRWGRQGGHRRFLRSPRALD